MAREGDDLPTEMPEKLFRQTADYAEIHELGRKARQERADQDALATAAHFGPVAGEASSPLAAVIATLLAITDSPRRVVVAVALVGWAMVIVIVLMWGGLV